MTESNSPSWTERSIRFAPAGEVVTVWTQEEIEENWDDPNCLVRQLLRDLLAARSALSKAEAERDDAEGRARLLRMVVEDHCDAHISTSTGACPCCERDRAWNDAIEAAAVSCERMRDEPVDPERPWITVADMASRIRTLARPGAVEKN